MENRFKEYRLDLFVDRTSAATMAAKQLRLWFASIAYVLSYALRRIGLAGHTSDFAEGETIHTENSHKFSVDGRTRDRLDVRV